MELYTRLKDLMLDETMVSHKPYSEMTKQEFKAFHKKNFELRNKWALSYLNLFIKNFKAIFPEGVINLKKKDKGFPLKDLKEDQILNAWTFNQKKAKEYEFEVSGMGKEIEVDSFFMNVLDWTSDSAPRDIDRKMEQVRDIIIKRMDKEVVDGKTPFDMSIVGDYDDLKGEGFFDTYPNLK